MTTTSTTPRDFTAHIANTAQDATPAMRSGLHESIGDFYAIRYLHADIDAPIEKFEPTLSNEWLSPGYAGAIAYRTDPSAPATDHPFILATYIEGDVTSYRFTHYEDAARAGQLWATGTPASAA